MLAKNAHAPRSSRMNALSLTAFASKLAPTVGLAMLLSACAIGPDYKRPDVIEPVQFKEAQGWRQANPSDSLARGAQSPQDLKRMASLFIQLDEGEYQFVTFWAKRSAPNLLRVIKIFYDRQQRRRTTQASGLAPQSEGRWASLEERVFMANQANQPEQMIAALRDPDPTVFTVVLENPGLTPRELLAAIPALDQARVERLAHHDPLTGLPNRRLFFDRLEHAIANAKRSGKRVGLLFVDLDHFKEINDELGHAIGDEVLCSIARLLSSITRGGDTVARLGGDEFIILFDQIEDGKILSGIAQKLLGHLQNRLLLGGHQVLVQASLGISLYPEHGDTAESLVQNADKAMYSSKRDGRNRVSLAHHEP